ncbi:ethanolamine kinase 1-like [Eriocheir sinensis]|uniref:ethanolamine kinase 1-like n=1 Tax=Eriocheir sinensis TaxID=95602 RepID=UPI0021C78A02|nr:ethanolamine kinase 1-like [Eriocheir sinensis]XP_050738991.1 ethanolamine kinase 1-like [Eriocheir sinensis]XP_050738992.1 ethanolamine kinase 1-like [Eriocheir sinensis]
MPLHINLTVDGSSRVGLEEGAKKIAVKLKPDWIEDNLQYQVYTSGITNQLIGVWDGERDSQVLVRVYGQGTDMFIDRDAEKRNIEILHSVGCAPKLHAVFNNGICYGFTIGIPSTPSLIIQEPVWRAVTQEMAKVHRTEGGDKTRPSTFLKIRHFLDLVPEKFESEKQNRLDEHKYNKRLLDQEITELEKILTSLGCPVVFSHNDILLGNVIWNENTKTASFIDFEYGAANYQAFDIGNHFNEFAGVDEVDYKLYPNKEFQYKWLRSYLSHYLRIKEVEVNEKDIEKWYIWTNKFALASHLFWACWALVQAHYSTIDFDFLGYSIIRLNEYSRRKDEFLSLSPEGQQD